MSIEKGPQIIDALTRPQEIVDKLKQHQIPLPDGQIVPARGIINRNLSSLVAAFREDNRVLGTKELIAPDTSAGIPIRKAEKRLRNAVRRLRTMTLMGTGWDVFTVRGKNGGYYLANTTSNTTENPFMETLILADGKTIIRLHPRPKAMFQRIIDSGSNGMTTEELQKPHIDAGRSKKTARFIVHDDLTEIRAALHNKPFKIKNLTSKADNERGKGGRYVFMQRSQEELDIIDQQRQNGTPVIAGGVETTVFVAKADATQTPEPISEDPQEEYSSPWREWDSHENTTLRPEIPKKRFNELNTKPPEVILGVKTTIQVLSSLLEGSLAQSTKDTKTLLTKTLNSNHSDFGRMKLDTLFNDSSPNRLNRFFQVNFTAIVDDCWNKEITPDTPREEGQIIEIINQLKEKSYDKTRIIQEVLGHFGIKIPDRPEPIKAV